MSLWKIAWRSIQQRGLASTLTGLSMALGVTLVVAVLVIYSAVDQSFNNAAWGYHTIVGKKGGSLQLVLNTVYYLSQPIENLPYDYYKEFIPPGDRTDGKVGKFSPFVEQVIPICLGDFYGEFRVVGTTPAMLGKYFGREFEFAAGENFRQNQFFSGVIGSQVARETGLTVGSKFQPSHGVPDGHEHEPFTVVGVLRPTGTPFDRGLFINMEGFYLLEGHAKTAARTAAKTEAHDHEHGDDHNHPDHKTDAKTADAKSAKTDDHDHEGHDHGHEGHDHTGHDHHEPLPESQREVTAILVKYSADEIAMVVAREINKDVVAQAVSPVQEVRSLFDTFVGPVRHILLGLTGLIVLVSGIGILVSIYNSMSDRRREIAVMRALGADRTTVMLIVLCESILLSLLGGVCGWLLGHGLIAVLSPWIAAHTGTVLGFWRFDLTELILIPGLIALASLVGYLPALSAYRTDVAKVLSGSP